MKKEAITYTQLIQVLTMSLIDFLNMYDNWNGLLTINDDELMETVGDTALYSKWVISKFVDVKRNDPIMEAKVIAFGFYDGELCIRVKQ